MKRDKIEQLLFETADKLTPEPRSFDSIQGKIDWDGLGVKTNKAPKHRLWLFPALGGTAALAIAMVAVILLVNHGRQDPAQETGILFGTFSFERGICSNPSFDFSKTSLICQKEKTDDSTRNAQLLNDSGKHCGNLTFIGDSFSGFHFGELLSKKDEFLGKAMYSDFFYPISVRFVGESSDEKRAEISFGDVSTPAYGLAIYRWNE